MNRKTDMRGFGGICLTLFLVLYVLVLIRGCMQ